MHSGNDSAGSLVALWRYPVKSMQGEEIDGAAITERGIVGDRAYAILDRTTGHVASAKHPRKWSRLFACRAAFAEPPRAGARLPPIWITLPDGDVVHSDQTNVDQALSQALGREVTLIRDAPAALTREADRTPADAPAGAESIRTEPMALAAPAGTFFDYAPLHALTTAALDRLRALYPAGRWETRRFRPNLVIAPAGDAPGFVENAWLGHALALGPEVRLQLIDPCPRCVVTTLAQSDLPRDPGILRTLTEHNAVASLTLAPGVVFPAVAGIYASVLQAGTIRRGDSIRLA